MTAKLGAVAASKLDVPIITASAISTQRRSSRPHAMVANGAARAAVIAGTATTVPAVQ